MSYRGLMYISVYRSGVLIYHIYTCPICPICPIEDY